MRPFTQNEIRRQNGHLLDVDRKLEARGHLDEQREAWIPPQPPAISWRAAVADSSTGALSSLRTLCFAGTSRCGSTSRSAGWPSSRASSLTRPSSSSTSCVVGFSTSMLTRNVVESSRWKNARRLGGEHQRARDHAVVALQDLTLLRSTEIAIAPNAYVAGAEHCEQERGAAADPCWHRRQAARIREHACAEMRSMVAHAVVAALTAITSARRGSGLQDAGMSQARTTEGSENTRPKPSDAIGRRSNARRIVDPRTPCRASSGGTKSIAVDAKSSR